MKDEKIIICIVSHFGYYLFNPNKNGYHYGGGAEVQLFLITTQLLKNKDIEINVITGKFKDQENIIHKQGVKIFKVLPIKRRFLNYIIGPLHFMLTLIKIKPDIVIQRSASVLTGLSALYCNLFKKKFIYSVANNYDVNGKAERGFKGKIYRYGLNNASCIVAQNNDQIKFFFKHKKRIVPNIIILKSGYQINEFNKKKKNFILWVGRAIEWKRPEIFLKLALLFPEEPFLLVLNKRNNFSYWNKLYKISSKMPNIKFRESIPFVKIGELFSKAKIFINTSINNEGFPNTFIQAFISKTPVISLLVNPDNILSKYNIGLCCNNNFEQLKRHLTILLEDPTLIKIYSENAFKYAKKHHDIVSIGNQWLKLIKTILKNRNN